MLLGVFYIFGAGCAHRDTNGKHQKPAADEFYAQFPAGGAAGLVSLDQGLVSQAESAAGKQISIENNAQVAKWIRYITTKDRERFQRFLNRGQLYREVVASVLEENDLPAELYYLAMIESGYSTSAHSHAQAMGVWQFIAGTAERYGLEVNPYVDERRDPIRSTEAAAKYLRDLYNVFGSWPLAMAAYNAGEIRVLRAVFKGRSRDFWQLVEAKVLPQETAEYVPKFLAFAIVGENPQKYGFQIEVPSDPYPSLEAFALPGSINLATLAKATNTPLARLRRVNPHLRGDRTPTSASYELWVPTQDVENFKRIRPQLAGLVSKPPSDLAAKASSATEPKTFYKVQNGDTLSSIAHRHKISVGHLRRINDLGKSQLMVGTKLRLIPKSYAPSKTVAFKRYKVRRGDNLVQIARRFKTSVEKIRHANQLKGPTLIAGQILRIETLDL